MARTVFTTPTGKYSFSTYQVVGSGANATVFGGWETARPDAKVVVRRPHSLSFAASLEARVLAELKDRPHPHVLDAPLESEAGDGGQVFQVFPRYRADLHHVISTAATAALASRDPARDRTALSEARTREITRQVCEALRFLRDSFRVAHGDVKPENIFMEATLERDGRDHARLGDLGLLRPADRTRFARMPPTRFISFQAPEVRGPAVLPHPGTRTQPARALSTWRRPSAARTVRGALSGQPPPAHSNPSRKVGLRLVVSSPRSLAVCVRAFVGLSAQVFRSQPFDPLAVDVWSVGMSVVTMLTCASATPSPHVLFPSLPPLLLLSGAGSWR